jgi:hypothetical protein
MRMPELVEILIRGYQPMERIIWTWGTDSFPNLMLEYVYEGGHLIKKLFPPQNESYHLYKGEWDDSVAS